MNKNKQPFFSIGVTTYDRLDLLKEALSSIVSQTYPDFEVIVGNDNPHQVLSSENLNINDERISFVNRPTNLGELPNMNDLLARSRGRYFTWLADDDMYAPDFLESAYSALSELEFPFVLFTGYMAGSDYVHYERDGITSNIRVLTGRAFLNEYLSRSLKIIGCYGLFSTGYIRKIGGMEKLGNGFSPYSDNLLAIKSGLLEKIIVIDAPLIFFRTHVDSMSYTSPDLTAYESAQHELLFKSIHVFRDRLLRDDFNDNLFLLLKWCIEDFYPVMLRSGRIQIRKQLAYVIGMFKYIGKLRKHRCKIFLIISGELFKIHKLFYVDVVRIICNLRMMQLLIRFSPSWVNVLQKEHSNSGEEPCCHHRGWKALKILPHRLFHSIKMRCNSIREDADIRKYLSSGQKPWTTGYNDYKELFISRTLQDNDLLDCFLHDKLLPINYGFRLDERCVEYPWLFSRFCDTNRSLLDAGSALNFKYLLNLPVLKNRNIVIYTLSPEGTLSRSNISYIYGDLRQTIIKSEYFDEIVCISTLEHIGMDNTVLYSRDDRFAEFRPNDYQIAVKELYRLMKPEGKLYITVPYGRYSNHGWLQVFDKSMVDSILKVFDGSVYSVSYYRYEVDGWQISSADDCVDCTYFDIHQQPDYDSDYAAAARAVACMELIK